MLVVQCRRPGGEQIERHGLQLHSEPESQTRAVLDVPPEQPVVAVPEPAARNVPLLSRKVDLLLGPSCGPWQQQAQIGFWKKLVPAGHVSSRNLTRKQAAMAWLIVRLSLS